MKRLAAVFAAFLVFAPLAASAQDLDPENTLIMRLEDGEVVIRLRPDLAPNHVERIKKLTREGFYDDTPFHRVIEGFMAQGGDPTGTGTGGSQLPDLDAEFTNTNFTRGTIGMARTPDPNSANSQFFICFQDCSFLNGQYTVWGEVVEGMELVDALKRGEPVPDPDRIVMMQVAGDTN
ncbi:peptidylprolyl isomerase [Bauldia sp.]|uniref:peptidylprolyl isomerase n=1 Tax=Bauldia sp. TaxID=2575872 RepID=UPI003BAA93AE